jgi:vitamin B12 transporter
MRKKFMLALCGLASFTSWSQDSLKTTHLREVVVTGTKFGVPLEKSGKTIVKLDEKDLQRNAGKSLADLLNEIPGIQMDGNFSTPGTNASYYVRGGRNKHTLVLIDGVPLNDPSAINAEYDLRYIPLSQIESIEVLKGGLGTLYGTSAAAGVISIRFRKAAENEFSGVAEISAASYETFAQNLNASGTRGKFSYMLSADNQTSGGFSSAQDNDPVVVFDKDGFSRQNGLVRLGYKFNEYFTLDLHSAYEQFKADYDAYEFTDASNTQKYDQFRIGLNPQWKYTTGAVDAKVFYNVNERVFESNFPSQLRGRNLQGEVIHRHSFSTHIQTLAGVNYQRLAFEQQGSNSADSSHFTLIDPYASVFIDLPTGLNVHAGLRLNTHNLYGSRLIYNLNPSFVFNRDGDWKVKILASVSTSYITPSLYQLYSFYGNKTLVPERSLNYETGLSFYNEKLLVNVVGFRREETDPIDFVSLVDEEGNYIGGQYRNLTHERTVEGIEIDFDFALHRSISVAGNYTVMETDKPVSFYKIPKTKYGASLNWAPVAEAMLSVKYNFTGQRTTFDFANFSEVDLKSYQLIDLYASYGFLKNNLTVFGAVNNVLNEDFVALLGYTTRGRNFSIGVRYRFGS